jgi:hypothetical protein
MQRVRHESFAGRSVIHYGDIGSATAVIKISATRKRLKARLKKVICVKIGLAELMDKFQCRAQEREDEIGNEGNERLERKSYM